MTTGKPKTARDILSEYLAFVHDDLRILNDKISTIEKELKKAVLERDIRIDHLFRLEEQLKHIPKE